MKITKIYTRRGDTGMTDLIGGIRISKTDTRIEAYGTVDELSSQLGLLAAVMEEQGNEKRAIEEERETIIRIQNCLFSVCSHLATDQSQTPLYPSAHLPQGETAFLEKKVDMLNNTLAEPQGFILPGGTRAAAQAHVCRTVCRRAERRIIELAQVAQIDPEIIQYINRLSDYLFILAKIINFNMGHSEIIWQKTCK